MLDLWLPKVATNKITEVIIEESTVNNSVIVQPTIIWVKQMNIQECERIKEETERIIFNKKGWIKSWIFPQNVSHFSLLLSFALLLVS